MTSDLKEKSRGRFETHRSDNMKVEAESGVMWAKPRKQTNKQKKKNC